MNRAELYDAVWSAPMAQAAAAIGVGERALANACRKAGSPTPPRGHWRKVAAGQAGERPPLGEAPAGQDAITMPRDAASRRAGPTPPAQPWPTGLLAGSKPDGPPPSAQALTWPDFPPQMVAAVVDALVAECQRAEARRVLLAQAIGLLSADHGRNVSTVRQSAEPFGNPGAQ